MTQTISTRQCGELRKIVYELDRGLIQEEYTAILLIFNKAIDRMIAEQKGATP